MGQRSTYPTPTTAGKQPNPKKQTATKPKDGVGALHQYPSSQKEKIKMGCDSFLRKQTGKLN
jgi:hypothetical protein